MFISFHSILSINLFIHFVVVVVVVVANMSTRGLHSAAHWRPLRRDVWFSRIPLTCGHAAEATWDEATLLLGGRRNQTKRMISRMAWESLHVLARCLWRPARPTRLGDKRQREVWCEEECGNNRTEQPLAGFTFYTNYVYTPLYNILGRGGGPAMGGLKDFQFPIYTYNMYIQPSLYMERGPNTAFCFGILLMKGGSNKVFGGILSTSTVNHVVEKPNWYGWKWMKTLPKTLLIQPH